MHGEQKDAQAVLHEAEEACQLMLLAGVFGRLKTLVPVPSSQIVPTVGDPVLMPSDSPACAG